MSKKGDEYTELFLAEAQDNYEEINRLLTLLEKNPEDKDSINALFRIIHTMKGNASAMGFKEIAELSHAIEDLFDVLRAKSKLFNEAIFSSIFKAIDVLGNLIDSVKSGDKVRYKGIKTKLEVLTRNITGETETEKTKADENQNPTSEEADNSPKNEEVVNDSQEPIPPATPTPEEESLVSNAPQQENKIAFNDHIQIPVRKLDNLLDLVGELIIERDRIITTHSEHGSNSEYSRLTRITSDLQYSVMDVRLVQVGFLFKKFHRVVRDAANAEHKKVNLVLEGTDTEIDRNILQIMSDSLVHIVRNSVGHGIELPDDRMKQGKDEAGTVILRASNENDSVIIDIIDDGAGINIDAVRKNAIEKGLVDPKVARQLNDEETSMFIFEPGFSTSKEISKISGRGVGMDVVKSALDSVGGNIKASSETGKGTTITLRLPSSMALKATLLFELNSNHYAIPLSYTESVISIYKSDLHRVGKGLVATHLNKTINIVFLKDLFNKDKSDIGSINFLSSYQDLHPETKLDVILVSYSNKTIGLVVDRLLQRKEIVEKPLRKPVENVKYISGVTILGNGNVCLVINVAYIITSLFANKLKGNKGIIA